MMTPAIHSRRPWSRVLPEKLTGPELVKKLPALYGTRHSKPSATCPLAWARSAQSMPPHPTSWRLIWISSSHLGMGLPSGLLPLGFSTETVYAHFLSHIRATRPAHPILLDLTTRIMSVRCNDHKHPRCAVFTNSLFGPNIYLSCLFSKALTQVLPQRDGPSFTHTHTHKTITNIWVPNFVPSARHRLLYYDTITYEDQNLFT